MVDDRFGSQRTGEASYCLDGDRGFALVSVLWGLVVLSLIAASVVSSTSFSYRMERNAWCRIAGGAIAEAGVNRAILALLDARADQRWRVDGTPVEFALAGVRIRASIQDELGKIDLNGADGSVLMSLLQSAGLSFDEAQSETDKILDWRDSGPTHRLNGAKGPEYRAAGYAYGPRNKPFQSVDELRLVLGMTPELFARIEPALTVYSGRQFINPQTAPREALLALPTMDGQQADAVLAARHDDGIVLGGPDKAPPVGVIDPETSLAGRAFSIHSETVDSRCKAARAVVIRMTDDPVQPYWVLSWR